EEPEVRMAFVGRSPSIKDDLAFERKLYVIRHRLFNEVRYAGAPGGSFFYIPSFSSRTIVFKGMLTTAQVAEFYPDLTDPRMESALALVHSRFSTNTFPSWDRAHPYRYVAHNGEINTLRGNVNWMHARESQFASPLFGEDMEQLKPIVHQDGSDSAMFDNCFEFLVLSGRPLAHAAVMMIPEPWAKHGTMPQDHKDFYEYHSCLMEPWDGPAAVAFTDGTQIGAVLDRNGLRPCRYYVTKDDLVVMASEVGVLDIEPERVALKGRLQPGRIFLVDTKEGRIISDEEIKASLAKEHPYGEWLKDNLTKLEDLPAGAEPAHPDHETVTTRQFAFGYTQEDLNLIIAPMARTAVEPIGSMGNDSPLAALSDKPKLLYNYFKQLFAQVTNPPIDSIREEIVTSTITTLGSEGNLLEPTPQSCRQIQLASPVITNEELEKLRVLDRPGFKSATLPIHYEVAGGGPALEKALSELFKAADRAIAEGVNILILSDRGVTEEKAAIPALL
ncbi:MAG: glutamate synthase subunit alpha, partial [Chthoniobacterales bacterium]|nr:glutamate synthase subunit alpha [Chthoniobacterales bacterium]